MQTVDLTLPKFYKYYHKPVITASKIEKLKMKTKIALFQKKNNS